MDYAMRIWQGRFGLVACAWIGRRSRELLKLRAQGRGVVSSFEATR